MKKFILILAALGLAIGCALCLAACSGEKEYSIICDNPEEGRVIVADNTVKAGENVILAAKPNNGYQLVNFILEGEKLDGCSFIMPEKPVTVSAEFKTIEYTLTYDFGGEAENVVINYTVKEFPDLLDLPAKDGFEKHGWYLCDFEYDYENKDVYELRKMNPERYIVTSLEGLFGNITLYAKYYNPLHEITCLNGDTQNGSLWIQDGEYSTNQVYRLFGETVNIEVEPNTGYELDYITVNGTPIDGTTYTVETFDVEIEAVFKIIRYKITYIVDGEEFKVDYYTYGDDTQLPELPEAENGYYAGWCDDEECGWNVGGINTYACEDLIFYAKFVPNEW